ncbi:MAG: hypothetical protein J6O70_08990 [Lachnospiraceae bacterium]|nr:hypothetical protein [Lachnospiraceae bacterium]
MRFIKEISSKLHDIPDRMRRCRPMGVVLAIAVVLQFGFIAYANLFTIREVMDNDMAKLFVHIAEMWRTKSVLIPGWVYDTTVEIDCSSVLAVFIYGITGDIYISFGIANIIFLILYLYIIARFAEEAGFTPEAGRLAMLAVMIPYSFGQLLYFDMMFFGGAYYCMKVAVPLIAIYLFVSGDVFGKRRLPLSVICLCFTFITAFSSGVYVFVSGVLPVLMVYVLISRKTRERSIYALIMTVLSSVGIMLNMTVPYDKVGLSGSIVTEDSIGDSVRSLIMCFIEMMGGLPYEQVSPVSVQGIKYVMRFVLILLLIVFAVVYLLKASRSVYYAHEGVRSEISVYIAALICVDMLILVLTGLGTQSRYLLPSFIPLLIIFAMELWEKAAERRGTLAGILLVAAVSMVTLLSDRDVVCGEPYPFYRADSIKYDALDEILAQYPDMDAVFLNDIGTTEIIRARNLEDSREYVTYMCGNADYEDGMMVCDYYSRLTDPGAIDEKHILVVNEYFGDISMLPDGMAGYYEQVGEYQIFSVYVSRQAVFAPGI